MNYLVMLNICCVQRTYYVVALFTVQYGTSGSDKIRDAANGLNNTFVAVGISFGNWSGTNAGSGDMVATKLDINGDVLWKWQVRSRKPYTISKPDKLNVKKQADSSAGQWSVSNNRT